MSRRGAIVVALAALMLAAAGCGKRGPLKPPEDAEVTYPGTYPAPETVVPQDGSKEDGG